MSFGICVIIIVFFNNNTFLRKIFLQFFHSKSSFQHFYSRYMIEQHVHFVLRRTSRFFFCFSKVMMVCTQFSLCTAWHCMCMLCSQMLQWCWSTALRMLCLQMLHSTPSSTCSSCCLTVSSSRRSSVASRRGFLFR